MVELCEGKMAELEVSVPLAQFDTEEWAEFSDFQSSQDPNCNSEPHNMTCTTPDKNDNNDILDNVSDTTDTFKDSFSASLEDLVNTFDEKITKCFCNYEDQVEKYAPVQVRTQEEIMNECQMWWTITGNFGNILPIDWSKTYTRQQYLPVLNLNEMKEGSGGGAEEGEGGTERSAGDDGAGEEEEEEVAQDLDLHHLILNGLTAEPVKSAEEVIQEIDDIMQEGSSSEDECVESSSSGENMQDIPTRPCPPHLYHDKLKSMSVPELNEALMELELVIRRYSETLITQLALRDELEYEKELKNSFISLLLQVQNKRRNFNIEKKKQKKVGPNGTDPKYLTTVIPYDVGHGPPQNPTLQILIKILTAINEDSPTVPTLLTDYILKVLCPS
ncbi:fasciculation and elongation protein zeta-2-like isoform X3 [Scylla paramamosain]|uniref:fasciculation and elongation protein zeta-2-like isoform X3 n=1 Tax=Scylla paramamosain TaxID=85552 RepID=UPI0030839953